MNVLYVTYGLPAPPTSGARLRDFHLLQQLAARHRVTCAILLQETDRAENISALEQMGVRVFTFASPHKTAAARAMGLIGHLSARYPAATFDYWNESLFESLRRLTTAETFDVVQIEHSFLAPYWHALPHSPRPLTLLDLHNVGARQYHRMLAMDLNLRARVMFWLKQKMMQNWEVQSAARFDCVLTVSQAEADWLFAQDSTLPIRVIENGVDTVQFQSLPEKTTENPSLLFVGTLSYPPNVDAVRWFCGEILPLIRSTFPRVSLQVVGGSPRPAMYRLAEQFAFQLAADVPAVMPYYAEANLVIVPLRAGGGTRLKILEAMAYGRAVVSTPIGAEGLDVRDGETILLGDAPHEFAAQVIHLLQQPPECERIVRAARQLVETRYAWSRISADLLSVYDDVAR